MHKECCYPHAQLHSILSRLEHKTIPLCSRRPKTITGEILGSTETTTPGSSSIRLDAASKICQSCNKPTHHKHRLHNNNSSLICESLWRFCISNLQNLENLFLAYSFKRSIKNENSQAFILSLCTLEDTCFNFL